MGRPCVCCFVVLLCDAVLRQRIRTKDYSSAARVRRVHFVGGGVREMHESAVRARKTSPDLSERAEAAIAPCSTGQGSGRVRRVACRGAGEGHGAGSGRVRETACRGAGAEATVGPRAVAAAAARAKARPSTREVAARARVTAAGEGHGSGSQTLWIQ